MKVTSVWPDGTLIQGRSWRELEEQVRLRQWHKYSVGQFRAEMRRRAKIWAGRSVSIQSAERMFRGMEACGMVRLEVEERGDEDGASDCRH